jgi:hypothetical protein
MTFWSAPAPAPAVEVEDAEAEAPVADVAVPVLEAEARELVSEGPDAADPVGLAVPEVAVEPDAVTPSPSEIFSRPAVIVTGMNSLLRSLRTVVATPGSLASGPATVSTQVAISDMIVHSVSMVLRLISHFCSSSTK